ncbi:hypothetical protein DJ531_03005 [Sulfolobus sp. A20-N-F6]|uniref:hypothetical protein n=1 Tax=Saccharolobus sp. A20 TaxID=1891280 RepID=UPI0008462684|nr:hypothetical protein [Sulfolobus sp. A20]TRM73132.1 hypothetical protein DJ528_12260 [Sulfolobus sp. B5]TRM77764.1 hypothetical protein DJ532_03160 [Sulfolobus sp. A20-N-F8]TRM81425.1 hypothetical protein DJ524_04065 [Sulfolobus sp. D5]TRM83925.1 hypothetical protein DJ531_03005 [Sulfolobus sp. A20-N-F6]TRM88722.1 hypothetical protein DJ529_04385 [Sulfolobus sp. C3]TRM99058.1 hypothetical protein DJ527_09280 [Sulfolobus sp. F1]
MINDYKTKIQLKARRAAKEKRYVRLMTKEYTLGLFVFMGRSHDYVLDNETCTCSSYLFNCIYRKTNEYCYHIIGLNYALESDQILTIALPLNEIKDVLSEIYSYGKSLKLRKILNDMIKNE